jgi:hypothetical protein
MNTFFGLKLVAKLIINWNLVNPFLKSDDYDGMDDKGKEAEDWTSIFYYLGGRLMSYRQVTLWSDVFALSILLSEIPDVQVVLQPCFVEQHINQNKKAVEVCLRMLSLGSMKVLHTSDSFPVHCNGQYLIIPMYLYHHNPCVIQSLKLVAKNFTDREHYMATLLEGLHDHDFLVPAFIKAFPTQGSYPKQGHGLLFDELVDDIQCGVSDSELLVEIRMVEPPPNVRPPKTNTTPSSDLNNDKWTLREIQTNNQRVEMDMEIDDLNPSYMYPDLDMPWNDCYLKQDDPTLRQWWSGMYNNLPPEFKPHADHVYN